MRKSARPTARTPPVSELSEEDSRLFRETVGNVIAVNCERAQPVKIPPKPYPRRRQNEVEWSDAATPEIPLLATGDIMSFTAPGLQKRVLRRLRAGGFGVDAEIDLHGSTVDEARRRLASGLRNSLADGLRCMLIIHGKGYRSEGDYPVLKNRINLWLRQHPDVLAFCTAKPSEGGAGAVYVLLRDARKARDAHFD